MKLFWGPCHTGAICPEYRDPGKVKKEFSENQYEEKLSRIKPNVAKELLTGR